MAVINGTFLPDILIGTSEDDTINGFGGADIISGGGGNDVIDGGEGEDVLNGGEGNDTLIGGTGVATVLSLYSGGAGDDMMIASTLGLLEDFDGGADNDTVSFAARTTGVNATLDSVGIPLLESIRNVENLIGSAFADTLVGNDFANYIDGGAGVDSITGGGGDDFLFVTAGDTIVEAAGGGHDNVLATETYTLTAGAYVEVLSTTNHSGTAAINLTGNERDQAVVGNAAGNLLFGGGGNDWVDGLLGVDTMDGGAGDDFLFISEAADVVAEASGEGYDNVISDVYYVLSAGAHVEVMSTSDHFGTSFVHLVGNELANIVIGNDGSNFLDGGNGGIDRLAGRGGNDYLFVDTGDIIDEADGGGYDNVLARSDYALNFGQRVEVLSTTNHGGTAAINLTGNDYDNIVIGNGGANTLDGSFGHDRLDGLGGSDSYRFATYLSSFNWDTVVGFTSGDDKFLLDDAVFTGMSAGALAAGAFVTGTAALDADDRIIYDATTGALYFDQDGNGGIAAIQFALVEGAPLLAASDFTMI